jgi:hypothetical protein
MPKVKTTRVSISVTAWLISFVAAALFGVRVLVPSTYLQPGQGGVSTCVVDLEAPGRLKSVRITYDPVRHDTLVVGTGQEFFTAYSPNAPHYAGTYSWYIKHEPIVFQNRRYVKYGFPRILEMAEFHHAGQLGRRTPVPLFVWTGDDLGETQPLEIFYLPVKPGCEFQPYQLEVKVGQVQAPEE